MSLYFEILYNILNLDINLFSYNNNYNKDINISVQSAFKYYYDKRELIYKNKYHFFNSNYIKNSFMKNIDKENSFLTFFSKINKLYNALNKFVYVYKFKKSKLVVDTDLCLNKITLGRKNSIEILQENKKYLFKLEELISIIHSALTNAPGLFCEPLLIKNPYNNIPFNKSTLYNIYFSIRFNTNIYSDLFFNFFKLNFNLPHFYFQYEYLLKEYAIENFIKNSTINTLWINIIDMIDDYNFHCIKNNIFNRIKIDNSFPKKKLVKIMMPYLKLYMVSLYSLIGIKKLESKRILYKKLKRFNNYNSLFGCKKVKYIRGENNENIVSYEFNDDCIKFEDTNTKDFLNNHMNMEMYEGNNYSENNTLIENTIILNFVRNFDIESSIDVENSPNDNNNPNETNQNTSNSDEDNLQNIILNTTFE